MKTISDRRKYRRDAGDSYGTMTSEEARVSFGSNACPEHHLDHRAVTRFPSSHLKVCFLFFAMSQCLLDALHDLLVLTLDDLSFRS